MSRDEERKHLRERDEVWLAIRLGAMAGVREDVGPVAWVQGSEATRETERFMLNLSQVLKESVALAKTRESRI